MRRLNFLEDEPWDEVEDDKRVRWFGHPFETDELGASLISTCRRHQEVQRTCTTASRRCSSSSAGR
jgi:hypothetical protein